MDSSVADYDTALTGIIARYPARFGVRMLLKPSFGSCIADSCGTLNDKISDLRKMLRKTLRLPAHFDPVAYADRGPGR